ncbi:hypothetical protein DFH09DRAFT_1088563 [Mycena vulgaris]|nr:hypothetical protein DFH09DRAFT_1088563 [Mycena vulgaris]
MAVRIQLPSFRVQHSSPRLESPSEQPAAGAEPPRPSHGCVFGDFGVSSDNHGSARQQSRCLLGTAVAHPGSAARDPVHAAAHAEFEMVLGRPRGAWRFDDSLGRAGVPRLASAPHAVFKQR